MASSDLIAYIEVRTGEIHRGTARYNDESTDVLYLCDDFREQRNQSETDRRLDRVRPESTSKEEQSFSSGTGMRLPGSSTKRR